MTGFLLRPGLVPRMTFLVTAIWVAAGALALGVANRAAERSEILRQRESLAVLLDAAAPAAAAATFVRDPDLAREVVEGLVAARGVREAALLCEGRPLASARRKGAGSGPSERLARPIASPFGSQAAVGELVLVPDPGEAALQAARTASTFRAILLCLILGMALVLALSVHLAVIRPLLALSRAVHALDPQSGGSLGIPQAWGELGQLGRDIGRLVAGLTEALAQGRELRGRLEQDKLELRAILDNMAAGVFVLRGGGVLDTWNQRFEELLGQGPIPHGSRLPDLFGAHAARVASCLSLCEGEAAPASELLSLGGPGDQAHRLLRLSLDPIGPQWIQGTLEEARASQPGVAEAGALDPLTGALNRLGAERAMGEALANDVRGMGLVMIALGAGEPAPEVLRAAAARMAGVLGPTDRVARLQGGEFLLVLAGQEDPAEARRVGTRVLEALAPPLLEAGSLPAWAGATALGPGEEPYRQELLKRAGRALDLARAEAPFTCRVLP